MTSISSHATRARAATKCENEWISINFGHREKQKRWWSLLPIPMPYTQFHSREARARDAAEISKWVDSYEIGMGGVFDHAGYEYISETRNTFYPRADHSQTQTFIFMHKSWNFLSRRVLRARLTPSSYQAHIWLQNDQFPQVPKFYWILRVFKFLSRRVHASRAWYKIDIHIRNLHDR